MSVTSPGRLLHPSKVRAARARLLAGSAASLVQQVRQVICEPTRTQIVRALSPGPLSVTDLAAAIGRSRSAASKHLRVLRAENVVQRRYRGRVAYYSLTADQVAQSSLMALEIVARAAS